MAVTDRIPNSDVGPGPAGPMVLASRGRRSFMAGTWLTGAVALAVVAGLAGAGRSVILSVVGAVGLAGASTLAWRASHMRIELGDDTLVAHGAVRTVRIPRSDIAGVGMAALGNGLRGVAITDRDGRVFRLDAIASFRQYDEAEVAAGSVRAWAGPPPV